MAVAYVAHSQVVVSVVDTLAETAVVRFQAVAFVAHSLSRIVAVVAERSCQALGSVLEAVYYS